MRKSLLFIAMLVCLTIFASAATVVTLDTQGLLANNSYQASTTVTPNFLVKGNSSSWNCKLYTNENGTNGLGNWRTVQTNSNVLNNTNTSFSNRANILEIGGTKYSWDVFCNSSNDPTGVWGAGGNRTNTGSMNYTVDATSPSVTLNFPTANRKWYNVATLFRIGLTVKDNNPASCVLKTNLNASRNSTGNYVNLQTISYSNNTQFNFTRINATQAWKDNNSGAYLYSYVCNDSAGNTVSLGSNYTFFVDTVAPGAFIFNVSLFRTSGGRSLANLSNSTDHTPQIGWNSTSELNFSRYRIRFYNLTYANSKYIELNLTSRTANRVNMSRLWSDTVYQILITAFDMAGNQRNMSVKNFVYGTDSTNHVLSSGWNIVGNTGNNFTLSQILNWSGASTASIWNSTHQFQSHVSGGGYGNVVVQSGTPVLLYMGATGNLSDLVWNTSAINKQSVSLTNQSSSDYNLVMMSDWQDNKFIGEFDRLINCNKTSGDYKCAPSRNNDTIIDYFSIYNNTASVGSKYVGVVANWSVNNMTMLGFGNCFWANMKSSTPSPQTFNWSKV